MTSMSLVVFALSLAVSLDSFAVGTTYGMRRIRIPFYSLLVISCCSGLFIYLTMLTGAVLFSWLPLVWAERLGAGMLCLIGLWAVANVSTYCQERKPSCGTEKCASRKSTADSNSVDSPPHPVSRACPFVQILKKPVKADLDASGIITGKEVVLLGVALSLDALGAGFGAAMLGFTPWLTVVMIVLMSAGFLLAGVALGRKMANQWWVKRTSFLPGLVLILLGVLKLI